MNDFRQRFVRIAAVLTGIAVWCGAADALAQAPAPAPDPERWTGTAGAGLALTSGNSDTLNVNLAFDVTRGPEARNTMKLIGLYLRGEQENALVANRLSLGARDQFAVTPRAYVFGQVDYLRDTFKLIDYLVAPTAGVGLKVIDTAETKYSVDGGVGAVWEKNPGVDVQTSAALTAGEKLEHALTASATLKHAATGLWKADELADGLYTFSIGLGARLSERFQLSLDLLDTFKNRPPTPGTGKNDVALVTAITARF